MKRKIWVRRKDGVKQRYWKGRKRNQAGIFFTNVGTLNKDLKKLEKEKVPSRDPFYIATEEALKLSPKEVRDVTFKATKYKKNYGMAWSGKTTVPLVDFPESYGYEKEIKQMSPDEFLEATRKEGIAYNKGRDMNKPEYGYLLDPKEYERVIIDRKNVERLKPALISKEPKMDEPWLEFKDGEQIGHEGRHRAVAARELGMKKIPVHIVRKK